MAKQSGLGQGLWFNGVDLSNDVSALSGVHGGPAAGDFTGLDKSAHERIGLLIDGGLDFAPFFNPTLAHASLSALVSTDVHIAWATGLSIGSPAACIVAKQINYDGNRGADGMLMFAVSGQGNAYGLEWCDLLTAGKRTDTAATNGTAMDGGAQAPAATVTSGSAANPSVVTTAAPHGLVTGDSVTIAGTNKAALNLDWAVTVTGASTFSVPVDLTGGAATGGTFTKTSTDFGLAAYMQTFSFTGTSNTPKLQHSADNGVTDSFADITGAAFAAITSAPNYQRIQTTTTLPIKRYVRLVSVGTFNPSQFGSAFTRHPVGATG